MRSLSGNYVNLAPGNTRAYGPARRPASAEASPSTTTATGTDVPLNSNVGDSVSSFTSSSSGGVVSPVAQSTVSSNISAAELPEEWMAEPLRQSMQNDDSYGAEPPPGPPWPDPSPFDQVFKEKLAAQDAWQAQADAEYKQAIIDQRARERQRVLDFLGGAHLPS